MTEIAKVETPTTPTEKVETPIVETPVVETPKVETPVTPKANADSQEPKSLMDEANADELAAKAAEEKRLLETPEDKLSGEDKVKKADLVKANEAKAKLEKDNVVPEKYEFKVPKELEGKVTVDEEYAKEVSKVMKEANITQATATKLANLAAGQIAKLTAGFQKTNEDNFKNFVGDLKKETIAELSKDGKDWNKEMAFAAKSRDRLASPGLIDKLNKSGLANDIDVVRHFINIGRQISEGNLIEGSQGGAGKLDPLAVLYPNTTKT